MKREWRADAPPEKVRLALGRRLISVMNQTKWTELGLLLGKTDVISGHNRLLRSLSFGDDDYGHCVYDILPDLLGEVPKPPAPGPWAPAIEALPVLEPPRGLHERYPNLSALADYIELPEWLAAHDPRLFGELFVDATADSLMPDGTVLTAAEAAAARLEVAEMKRQVERIRRDHAHDPEGAVGQAKELLESACKTILGKTGDGHEVVDLPKLIKQTLSHLGLDAADADAMVHGDAETRALKRMLGGLANILNGANELRNARGTGHGRSGAPVVDGGLARLAVGLVLPAVVYLVEVYERSTRQALPDLGNVLPGSQPLSLGANVFHETFGFGSVVTLEGQDSGLIATVDFGANHGHKRLLTRYAPLQVL